MTATRSSAGLAVILVCGMLPRVALLPFGGVGVDRAGARRVALASDVVSGLAQLSIGVLLLAGHLAIAPIALAAAAGGAAAAFGVPATLPLVAGTVDDGGRLAANSLLGVASSATSVAGPAIAAALIFTVGAGWAFVLDAATFAVSAGTLALIRVRPVDVPRQPLRRDLVAGWTEVRAEALARVSAYDWLVSLGAQLLGYAAGPVLAQSSGFTWPLSGTAVLVVITLLVPAALPSVRHLRLRRA